MKFKALLTDDGVSLLERRFLPAFEKIGKVCHVYLTRDEFLLMHNVLSTDGVQAIARLPKETIFSDYRISSQNEDRIAFTVELGLLVRALQSSWRVGGEQLQIKLVKKTASATGRPLPFLSVESKGARAAIVQDVPISQPLPRAGVRDLEEAVELLQELPRTVVQLPDLAQLLALVERLKSLGEILEVGVAQQGDLTLRVATQTVSIGAEYRNLCVWGERAADDSPPTGNHTGLPTSGRLERAIARGQASAVKVNMKHFARSLQCHLTKPEATFCGIAANDACLVMMFQYAESALSLHYRLPVLDSEG
eukprot:TRINITY_DN6880_c0_g1_i3.p1 TRINITY_DN6880_c0_g1~~TRINITY_DN6880_c0_g1_i3.p1  ORF type:complete len:308 (-),score=51.45 TRINITY_DN6880_c0_g1_i3:281-1204(-)